MQRTREEIFEILVREHEPGLSAFVQACVHGDAAADDLVQETFIAAWRQLDAYQQERPFARWLRGIARNKILAHYRDTATANRHVRSLTPEALAAVSDQFDRLLPRRGDTMPQTLAALRDCLATLSATDQQIIHRAYDGRLTCRAIADELGHKVEAIKKRLQRARAQLRDCILGKLNQETPHA